MIELRVRFKDGRIEIVEGATRLACEGVVYRVTQSFKDDEGHDRAKLAYFHVDEVVSFTWHDARKGCAQNPDSIMKGVCESHEENV